MQLLSLKLCDFQAHEERLVQFGRGITTIKGPTDVGKSAVIRALRWLCLNDFAGDDFIREGAKSANVELIVREDKKNIIVRHKGRHNLYTLDGEEYKAFGQGGVPDEIRKLLNLSEINFQGQHDSPFWFNESAGEVSRRLNAVIDLSVIDSSLSYIAAQVRLAQERGSVVQERLDDAEKELAELESQRGRIEAFQTIKDRHEKCEKRKTACSQLEQLLKRMCEYQARGDELDRQVEQGGKVLKLALEARRSQKKCNALSKIVDEVNDLSKKVAPPNFTAVESAYSAWNATRTKLKGLEAVLLDIENQNARIAAKTKAANEAHSRFHSKLKGKECPTCHRPF